MTNKQAWENWEFSIPIDTLIYANDLTNHDDFHRKIRELLNVPASTKSLARNKNEKTKTFGLGKHTRITTYFDPNRLKAVIEVENIPSNDTPELLNKLHGLNGTWELNELPLKKRIAILPPGHEPPKTPAPKRKRFLTKEK